MSKDFGLAMVLIQGKGYLYTSQGLPSSKHAATCSQGLQPHHPRCSWSLVDETTYGLKEKDVEHISIDKRNSGRWIAAVCNCETAIDWLSYMTALELLCRWQMEEREVDGRGFTNYYLLPTVSGCTAEPRASCLFKNNSNNEVNTKQDIHSSWVSSFNKLASHISVREI